MASMKRPGALVSGVWSAIDSRSRWPISNRGHATRWTSPWNARATTARGWTSSSVGSATPDGEVRGWLPCWRTSGVLDEGSEVVFWGADRGTVAIRDNSGIVRSGITGTVEPDADGGLDLTITEQFARSMSLADALGRDNLSATT